MAKLFEILVPSAQKEMMSGLAPTGQTWPRGLAVEIDNSVAPDTADGEPTFKAATVTAKTVYFMRQPLTATGLPTDMQRVWGDDNTDAYVETPDLSPGPISVDPAPDMLWLRDDASHTLFDGSNPPTAVGDLCNFLSGKVQIVQTSQTPDEVAQYVVTAKTLSDDATYYIYTLEKVKGYGVA